jgi:hypothetical protein
MDITVILAVLGLGALLIPILGGNDDDEDGDIRGTPEDDVLNGTNGNDNILAFDGDDTIRAFDGDDLINAGSGVDFINAGLGNDTVNGGDGRDEIEGREGDDTLNGDAGGDVIRGGAGNDIINGGYGNDVVEGGEGDDTIFGGPGARAIGPDGELVNATDRTDTLRGQGGEDTLYIWGGDGLAIGGLDRNDAGIPSVDEKDELILVTGEAELRDDQGTTDFFALANIDDQAETFATITEFDLDEHRMILTIDMDLTGEADVPDIDFTLTQTTVDGVNGVLVEAVLVNEADFEDDTYETSSAFFRGLILDDINPDDLNIEIVQTDATTNDYFDPESTVAAIKAQIPANPPAP